MEKHTLTQLIKDRNSYLCVGLDPDLQKIPECVKLAADPVFAFNKAIIDATKPYCVAYKPNLAFYEALGTEGLISLKKTIDYIGNSHFIIADAKRGDIGNTSRLYASAAFKDLNCDAITVAPYMGRDSVEPFLQFSGKWVILLALTSNPGSHDFQLLQDAEGRYLFETVIQKSQQWATDQQLMYVVGATQIEWLERVRKVAPRHFLLVPGVGAQGGDLEAISKVGLTPEGGLLINASRSILYASNGEDFAEAARQEAQSLQAQMQPFVQKMMQ